MRRKRSQSLPLADAFGMAARKLVERSWEAADDRIESLYKTDQPRARAAAHSNAASFFAHVDDQLGRAERENSVPASMIEAGLDDPDFVALLHIATFIAARTSLPEKHRLLAAVVASRLGREGDSAFAMSAQLACSTIGTLTRIQLNLLGLLTTVVAVRPREAFDSQELLRWLTHNFSGYHDLQYTRFDLLHLDALNCVRETSTEEALNVLLRSKQRVHIDITSFLNSDLGRHLQDLWDRGQLRRYRPTTIGSFIGFHVHDQLGGFRTSFEIWG